MLFENLGRRQASSSSRGGIRTRPKRRDQFGLPSQASPSARREPAPDPQAGAELLTVVLQKIVQALPQAVTVLDGHGRVLMTNDVIPHLPLPVNDVALRIAAPASPRADPGLIDPGDEDHPHSPTYVSRSPCGCAADSPEITELEKLRRERVILIDAISNSAERERRRIGREMHDSTLQDLIAVGLILRQLRHLESDETVKEAFAEIRGILFQAQQELRTLSYLLHPPLLAEGGLECGLKSLVKGLAKRMNIQIDFLCNVAGERPSAEIEIALYRVAQEALINVHKHAFATHVVVQYQLRDNAVILEVRDNGVGLGGRSGYPIGTGVGIEGMRSRIEQLHGTLSFSRLRHGVLLRAVVPLRRSVAG